MQLLNGIGLGTYPFSNPFSVVGETEAKKIVFRFLDLGGKYVQTAPYYEGVEPMLGRILKHVPKESYYLCTLTVKNRQGLRKGNYSSIIEQCDDSLKYLGIDYIDLYMPSTTKATDAPFSETMAALIELKKQGKIREIGVCNVNLSQLQEFNETGSVKYVQNRFSLLNPSISDEFHSYCQTNGIGLIPWGIIERGLLTDKILEKAFALRAEDVRRKKSEFRSDAIDLIGSWAQQNLKPIADSFNTSIEALIIRWTLQQSNVAMAVTGATSQQQVERNFQANSLQLDSETLRDIGTAYNSLVAQIHNDYGKTVQEFLGNVYTKAKH